MFSLRYEAVLPLLRYFDFRLFFKFSTLVGGRGGALCLQSPVVCYRFGQNLYSGGGLHLGFPLASGIRHLNYQNCFANPKFCHLMPQASRASVFCFPNRVCIGNVFKQNKTHADFTSSSSVFQRRISVVVSLHEGPSELCLLEFMPLCSPFSTEQGRPLSPIVHCRNDSVTAKARP